MTSKAVRVAVLIVALGGLVAGGYLIFDAEQILKTHQSARTSFDAEAHGVLADLAGLRSAEQAYVAEGQGVDYWMGQATDALGKVDRGLASLAGDAVGDGTRSAIQAASGGLEDFRKLDQRARQYVKGGQGLMASDLIFTDSLTALTAVANHIAIARANEVDVQDAFVEALRWRELYGAGGAALLLTLAVLLLAPVPEREVDVLTAMRALTETSVHPPKPRAGHATTAGAGSAQPSRALPPVDDDVPDLDTVQVVTRRMVQAAPVTPVLDLPGAAKVCADMARVLDAGDLPGLLLRLADVLEAPGLIVWVADGSGQVLYPLLAHGYSAASLARMGSLPTSAENATATAWRTGQVQTVPGQAGALGALVAPIVTAEGCVGVLAAEVPDGAEVRADVRALATIFAAQLATFVNVLPATGGQTLVAEA